MRNEKINALNFSNIKKISSKDKDIILCFLIKFQWQLH